jgi:hypothetical protein
MDEQYEPLFATLARSLARDGLQREVAVLTMSAMDLKWFEGYQDEPPSCLLTLIVPYQLYSLIEDRRECEQTILHHISPLQTAIPGTGISEVSLIPKLVVDDKWREKALAWLAGERVNNQGRVRSDNIASRLADGLQFRSEQEINLYKALKSLGVSFAPLPVFVRGGQEYRRIEPDFVIIKNGVIVVVEVDGDTYHQETAVEAQNRTTMLEYEGATIIHVTAQECETPELAANYAKKLMGIIGKLREVRR